MTDGVAILDDIGTFWGILDEYFVTSWCVLIDHHLQTVYLDNFSFLLGLKTYHHAVGGVDL